jgi:hypothetical protein
MSGRINLIVLALLLVSTAALADDLTGADKLLCTSIQATRCSMEDECASGPPWNWNIPQFIEVDLKKRQLNTTAASGENRVTPVKTVEREDGWIYLQGIEGGRAFSFVIAEDSGDLTVAVATAAGTTAVFGACTPR